MCVCVCVNYLRGRDGWRHLVTKVGLRGDVGLGATSALCYAASTHHGVYILRRHKTNKNIQFCIRQYFDKKSFLIVC